MDDKVALAILWGIVAAAAGALLGYYLGRRQALKLTRTPNPAHSAAAKQAQANVDAMLQATGLSSITGLVGS